MLMSIEELLNINLATLRTLRLEGGRENVGINELNGRLDVKTIKTNPKAKT